MRGFRFISALITVAFALQPMSAVAQTLMRPDKSTTVTSTTPLLIVGSYGVGGLVRAIYPSSDPTISSSFEWFADGQLLPLATSSQLAITAEFVGKRVSARITLRKPDFEDLVVSVQGAIVHNGLPTSGSTMGYKGETINLPGCFSPRSTALDTPSIGWTIFLSCNPWNTDYGNPTERKFAWYRNGSLIDGASGQEYRLQPIDSGREFWGFFQTTYENGYVFTEAKKLAAPIPFVSQAGKPTIKGTLTLHATLTAQVSSPDEATAFSYQWFSDYLPVAGATSKTFKVRSQDVGKAVQVMVTAEQPRYATITKLSDPAVGAKVPPLDAMDAYSKIYQAVQTTTTNYDMNYIVSPTVTEAMLAREKTLLQRAADYWAKDYTPSGVTVVYVTKVDSVWAENLVQQHPSWVGSIQGGITSWINKQNCGFALAFMADGKQVFIECLHDGADRSLQDDSVGAHEYTHWFQYAQNPAIYLYTVPWLVEGQGNFFGQALNTAPKDPKLQFINFSLAGYATQWDIYNGYPFASFKQLDILDRANVYENEILLQRNGMVWDQYLLGSLVCEWLVSKFGADKLVSWTKLLMATKGQNRDTESAANAVAFKSTFGFEYADLATWITPYLAARSAQLRAAWFAQTKNQINQQTLFSTQQVPDFTVQQTSLNDDQKDWITRRVKDGPIRLVVCTANYSSKSSKSDIKKYQLRAKNSCDFAKSMVGGFGVPPIVSTKLVKKANSTLDGAVFLTF